MSYISFQPNDYFNTVLWTTDGTGNKALTTGHSTDMVWIKFRDYAYDHRIYDDVRGVTKKIIPNKTDAESTTTDLASFDTNGFTVGSNLNSSGEGGLVGWSWKANGSGSSNTDGDITSTVSVNTTSGFSIVKYTGDGTTGQTVGHGLGSVPKLIINKQLTTQNWFVYHHSIGNTKVLKLNTTDAETTSSAMNNTTPTSSVFTIGTSASTNVSGEDFINYCFAEKKGFSKFGSYTGNGSTSSSPFIYTGFSPAFVIVKRTDASANWVMTDNKISFNGKGTYDSYVLFPSLNNAETDSYGLQLYSNGFGFAGTDSASATVNGSGANYIFMAFAEEPLVSSNGVPATAR